MLTEDIEVIQQTLNVFQQILNWCQGIEQDEDRLPLDLMTEAIESINEVTRRFQPELVRPQHLLDQKHLETHLLRLEESVQALAPSLQIEEYCEDCRIQGDVSDPIYVQLSRYVCGIEHLKLATSYFRLALMKDSSEEDEEPTIEEFSVPVPGDPDYFDPLLEG